jgi:RimJ/RimL family protein N-acetyltransferase
MDVRLVPFGAEHLDAFAPMAEDPDALRFTRFPNPPEPGFPARWLARYDEGRRTGAKEAFAILGPAGDDTFYGVALAVAIDPEADEAELGYLTTPAARGRGVATAALRRLTDWAFDERGLKRVTLLIDDDNKGSERVAQKAGYAREGLMRGMFLKPGRRGDMLLYAKLASDPA